MALRDGSRSGRPNLRALAATAVAATASAAVSSFCARLVFGLNQCGVVSTLAERLPLASVRGPVVGPLNWRHLRYAATMLSRGQCDPRLVASRRSHFGSRAAAHCMLRCFDARAALVGGWNLWRGSFHCSTSLSYVLRSFRLPVRRVLCRGDFGAAQHRR